MLVCATWRRGEEKAARAGWLLAGRVVGADKLPDGTVTKPRAAREISRSGTGARLSDQRAYRDTDYGAASRGWVGATEAEMRARGVGGGGQAAAKRKHSGGVSVAGRI